MISTRTILRKVATAGALAGLAAWAFRSPAVHAQSGPPTDYSYPTSCGAPGLCGTLACDALSDWWTEWKYGYNYYKDGGNVFYTADNIHGADVEDHYDCSYPVGEEKADSGDCSQNSDSFTATASGNMYDLNWEMTCTFSSLTPCSGAPSCSSAQQESGSPIDCGQGEYTSIPQ